jgi:outer membrane protein assembly factor BamB
VGTAKGELIALTPAGELQWRVRVSSEVLGPVSVAGGTVFVRAGDGKIFGLDAANGAARWEYDHSLPPLMIRGADGVALGSEVVYAGMPGGKMVALSAQTGALLWEAAVAQPRGDSELERLSDVVSVPVVEDGRACAVAYQGRIACFDAQKGTLVWGRAASGRGGLAADERYFYFVDDASAVHAIDRETGASVWKQDVLSHRGLGRPSVIGRFVAVGDFEGYLHFLDTEDGAMAARLSTDGSPIVAAPVGIGDANLLVQTTGGRVYAVSLR